MNKRLMITEILICMKANNVYVSGDIYFGLIFRTEDELRQMCREMHIQI